MMASLIRRCEFEMYETEWRDIGFVREYVVPCPAVDGRGLRVLVKGVE